ncbi:MAG: hypothetical protein Q7W05_11370, partial [Deltaproteobacteria bacterium]|nr:hypothetical protein [Deltaproteobacteria bacterium]
DPFTSTTSFLGSEFSPFLTEDGDRYEWRRHYAHLNAKIQYIYGFSCHGQHLRSWAMQGDSL